MKKEFFIVLFITILVCVACCASLLYFTVQRAETMVKVIVDREMDKATALYQKTLEERRKNELTTGVADRASFNYGAMSAAAVIKQQGPPATIEDAIGRSWSYWTNLWAIEVAKQNKK